MLLLHVTLIQEYFSKTSVFFELSKHLKKNMFSCYLTIVLCNSICGVDYTIEIFSVFFFGVPNGFLFEFISHNIIIASFVPFLFVQHKMLSITKFSFNLYGWHFGQQLGSDRLLFLLLLSVNIVFLVNSAGVLFTSMAVI